MVVYEVRVVAKYRRRWPVWAVILAWALALTGGMWLVEALASAAIPMWLKLAPLWATSGLAVLAGGGALALDWRDRRRRLGALMRGEE